MRRRRPPIRFHLTARNAWPLCPERGAGSVFVVTMRDAITPKGWHRGDTICVGCIRERRALRRRHRRVRSRA